MILLSLSFNSMYVIIISFSICTCNFHAASNHNNNNNNLMEDVQNVYYIK